MRPSSCSDPRRCCLDRLGAHHAIPGVGCQRSTASEYALDWCCRGRGLSDRNRSVVCSRYPISASLDRALAGDLPTLSSAISAPTTPSIFGLSSVHPISLSGEAQYPYGDLHRSVLHTGRHRRAYARNDARVAQWLEQRPYKPTGPPGPLRQISDRLPVRVRPRAPPQWSCGVVPCRSSPDSPHQQHHSPTRLCARSATDGG
jgi:hypothetical protein